MKKTISESRSKPSPKNSRVLEYPSNLPLPMTTVPTGPKPSFGRRMEAGYPIHLINRTTPGGFGRAIRFCIDHFQGEIVVIVMADLSDDPKDIVKYYDKINEGYDAVFGSRFMRGAVVEDYPVVKLLANRIGNKVTQLLFCTEHNDMTNAFKAYRADAVRSVMPLYSSHFNLTIEISLGIYIRRFRVARIPVNGRGRTWGSAKFKIRDLGRRYVATLLKLSAERLFIHDDLLAEHGEKLNSIQVDPLSLTTHAFNTKDGQILEGGEIVRNCRDRAALHRENS
jgi:dolichol-phosphate mannosyltransferase